MAPVRTRQIQGSFANGTLSPRCLGRVDMEKYYSSAEVVRDMIVMPQGGVKRRPGTQFVADANGPSRLIPFVFSPGVAYILELTNNAIRFYYAFNDIAQSPGGTFQPKYTAGAQIQGNAGPFQVATPYNTAAINLWDIQYKQQGDVMYFAHPGFPLYKLIRFGPSSAVPGPNDTNWRFLQVNFKTPPMDSFDVDYSGGTITLSPGGIVGDGVSFATSAPFFLDGDVSRMLFNTVDGGLAQIKSIVSSTVAICNILSEFETANPIPAGSWLMRGNPSTWAAPGGLGSGSYSGAWFDAEGFGVGAIHGLTSFLKCPQPNDDTNPPATVPAFRSQDVGQFLYVSGGIAQILVLLDSADLTIQWLSVPENTLTDVNGKTRCAPSPPGSWSIQEQAATADNGYFGAITFFQDRMFLAATAEQPGTFYGSVTGDYENFAKGTNAGDSFEFTLGGGEQDAIQWMQESPVIGLLAIETNARECVASGGGGFGLNGTQSITPTNITVGSTSKQGGCNIPPILIDSALVYINRYRNKVFEFAYNIYMSSFASKDLALYAEHLTHAGVKDMAYQANPYKIVWMVLQDGRMIGMTYDKGQDVCAFHQHITGAAEQDFAFPNAQNDQFVSVASIPNPAPLLNSTNDDGTLSYVGNGDPSYSSDLVWVVCKRRKSCGSLYTVELLNEDLMADSCSLQPTLNNPLSVTDSHLAGRDVVVTGAPVSAETTYFPFDSPLTPPGAQADTSLGNVTLDIPAASVTAYGLPFLPTLVTVRPEARGGGASFQGAKQRWSDLFIRVYNSLGFLINGKNPPFFNQRGVLPSTPASSLEPGVQRQVNVDDTMSDELPPLTTDIRVHQLGYDRFGRQTIQQPLPVPLTLLAYYGTLSVGDQ